MSPADGAAEGSALLDPFDVPDWLSSSQVVWEAQESVASRTVARGRLCAVGGNEEPMMLDVVAVDAAWPSALCSASDRRAAHQAWHFGQVVLLDHDGVAALGVPATVFSADLTLEALRRFAKAVGSDPCRFAAYLLL